ncbi:sensor histidine kinase [Rufibacter sediminis]|uniref:Histidine kinase n=1 Tax=Rufibacter sediminis TaxID=2762756 RepID=A0ABR6VQ82_9BACT|nr:histidine kinase [Rufibacter sediminis]MBC3539358.1 histidine kinase [Rufibacter sediminis]
MIQPDSYKKGLWKIALISSVAWGVISKFPMINARKPFFFDDRRPRPRLSREFPFPAHDENAFVSGAIITCFMLSLWLMNMYLYQWVSTFHRSDKTKNLIRYALSFLMAVVAYYLCVALILLVAEGPHFRIFPLIVALTNNTIIIVLMDLIILQRKSAQIAVENSELKMNHAIAQHQHLKHQLQPHFLFNSLNTLKSLIKKQRPEAEEYLVRLSDLLRASITAHQETTIPLKDELKLCVDYLEMQKVRFKDSFRYQIDVPDQVLSQRSLPVFSLQLLVENAIKHNAFTPEEPLTIQITYQEPGSIVVRNNKKAKQTLEPSSGIGLKNLSERYQVISGHGITITDAEQYFSVELTLL